MRRHGGLWEKILSHENINLAYRNAALHKSSMRNVKKFAQHAEANLEKIRTSLVEKKFTTSRYMEKTVYEPKQRTIYVLPFAPDRIVQHALMNVLVPIWDNLFITDSYACRRGKGIHAGSVRTMEAVRRNKYVLKCDISKFYPSINQDILLGIIKRKIKCPDTLWLIEDIIHSFPGGKNVPIGNYTSQWFGNLYLNELDQYIKHELKIKDYVRYCDDFCLFDNDKHKLKICRDKIGDFINNKLDLTFSKCDVFPVSHGVDFLGYRHFDNYILLRKRTTKRVVKRLAALPKLYERGKITKEQYRSSVASTYGWLKRANTYNLRVKIQLDELKQKVDALP
jgi:retron-type reverse transcriptase